MYYTYYFILHYTRKSQHILTRKGIVVCPSHVMQLVCSVPFPFTKHHHALLLVKMRRPMGVIQVAVRAALTLFFPDQTHSQRPLKTIIQI